MLRTRNNTFVNNTRCKCYVIVLAFLWILGLLIGVLFGHLSGEQISDYFRQAVLQLISVPGLIIIQIVPLLLFVTCVLAKKPQLLFLLLFADAVCCGFSIYGVCVAFGSAAWLVYWLLCFSDAIVAVILLWLSVRQFSGHKHYFRKDLVKSFILTAVIGVIDLFCISPFLTTLMNHS